MIIIHVACLSFSTSNGIKTVLESLVPEQIALGHSVTVFNLIENDQKIFESELFIDSYKAFRIHISRIHPSLIVFHGGYELKYYTYAYYLRKTGIPYIVAPHGGTNKQNLKKRRFLKTIVNLLFTRRFICKAAGVSYLNEGEKNGSIFVHDIHRYALIPNGISFNEHIINKPLAAKVHFIYVARIDFENKRPDVLLRAVEKFYVENPDIDFDFHFYGGRYDPSIVDSFRNMVKGAKGPVFYHGEVVGKDKEDAYMNGSIYLLTSLYEGMPLTVLEALSYGNPCIVTPQTNMADLIEKNNAGWVTNVDADSIAKTLLVAYNDYTANRGKYIHNAIEAVKPYRWDEIARKSIKEYTRLIGGEFSV